MGRSINDKTYKSISEMMTETAMGRHVDAQLKHDNAYVKAVCT